MSWIFLVCSAELDNSSRSKKPKEASILSVNSSVLPILEDDRPLTGDDWIFKPVGAERRGQYRMNAVRRCSSGPVMG